MEFFLNHVDSMEWFEKPRKVKKKIMGTISTEPTKTNQQDDNLLIEDAYMFLNSCELNELQGIYSDLVFGDLVITFPNPDHESVVNKGITMEDCLE